MMNNPKNKFKDFKVLVEDFAKQVKSTKEHQDKTLNEIEQSQTRDSSELEKISSQVKPVEETVAELQQATNLIDRQLRFRDETNQILKKEAKETKQFIQKLVNDTREYLRNCYEDFNQRIEKLIAWQILQERE